MKIRLITLLLALALGAPVAAGCGDDDNGDSGGGETQSQSSDGGGGGYGGSSDSDTKAGGGQTLKIDADPSGQLKFTKDQLSAKAGKVTIEMGNTSSLPHAVEIEGNGVEEEGETVEKGGKSVATADLKAGEYEFYCPVDGHQQGGMEGTLTVK